jgi:hypothetical protein
MKHPIMAQPAKGENARRHQLKEVKTIDSKFPSFFS